MLVGRRVEQSRISALPAGSGTDAAQPHWTNSCLYGRSLCRVSALPEPFLEYWPDRHSASLLEQADKPQAPGPEQQLNDRYWPEGALGQILTSDGCLLYLRYACLPHVLPTVICSALVLSYKDILLCPGCQHTHHDSSASSLQLSTLLRWSSPAR